MAEVIFKFDMENPDDVQAAKIHYHSGAMLMALQQIRMEIFRPARKHGYRDERLRELCARSEDVSEAIELLEGKFQQILDEYDLLTLDI